MAKKHINIQLSPDIIALTRFASKYFEEPIQATIEDFVYQGLQNAGLIEKFKSLTSEEKNKYCKGLDLKY